jgi:AI-2 transport protein TqsA
MGYVMGKRSNLGSGGLMEPEEPIRNNTWPGIYRTVLMLAILFGLALGIRATRGVAAPILLGLVVAVAVSPIIGLLLKRGVPPVLAYIISLFAIAAIIIALLGLLSVMVMQMTDLLPNLQTQLTTLEQDVVDTLAGWGINVSGVIKNQILNPGNIIGWISSALAALYGALKSAGLILFIVAYMLVEAAGFRTRFYGALGQDRPAFRRWMLWGRDTRSYLWITTILAVVVAILNFVLLLALRVPYPFTWALLSFLMSYIPNVGFLIALVAPLSVAILQRSWGMAVGVFVGYLLINLVVDNILKPRFLKSGLDLPPAVSFLSLLVWGFVLGPIGALLAVPMTMMVRTVFLEASPETEALALLLRSGTTSSRKKKRAWSWLRKAKGGGMT